MQPFINKVIRASAGTGKTYRLSLEYVGLLLKFQRHGIHFSEILVITFTRKATAEIRNRIFQHLQVLTSDRDASGERAVLLKNLAMYMDVQATDADLAALREVYHDMLRNKHQVRVQTIDAFVQSIFKTIIAPFLGITDFQNDDALEPEILAELAGVLLGQSRQLERFRDFFQRANFKTIENYDKFIDSLIRHRWLYEVIRNSAVERPWLIDMEKSGQAALEHYRDQLLEMVEIVVDYWQREKPDKSLSQGLNKDFYNLIVDDADAPISALPEMVRHKVNEKLVCDHLDVFMMEKSGFWNGGVFFKKKAEAELKDDMKERREKAAEELGKYILFKLILPEEQDIFAVLDAVLDHYDAIKLRDKVFTHDDIAFYTFKHLYDPELSLIENDAVANAFYEYLSGQIRFMLIDEFQDTSVLQYKILLPIIREVISGAGVKEYGGAIVVGDEKQAIYGWRGGERDLLPAMPNLLRDADEQTLDTSYRSYPQLIEFINAVFGGDGMDRLRAAFEFDWPYEAVQAHKTESRGFAEAVYQNVQNYSGTLDAPDRRKALESYLKNHLQKRLKDGRINGAKTAILARQNSELTEIGGVLDELGIPYILESASSILDHRLVKPIFQAMQALAFGDIYALLTFLRSDFVLLDTRNLKTLAIAYRDRRDQPWNLRAFLEEHTDLAEAERFLDLLDDLDTKPSVAVKIQRIAEEYNATSIYNLESDYKNLHQFLKLAAEFEQNERSYPRTLVGFLRYCEDNRKKGTFKQVGLDEVNAINLMTIHKSKGLQFETVLLSWDLSARGRHDQKELIPHVRYTPDYSEVEDFLLTFNYDSFLEHTPLKAYTERRKQRENIDTLNMFYVALTRAETNLLMYFRYSKKEGFDVFVDDPKRDKPNLLAAATAAIRSAFPPEAMEQTDEFRETMQWGTLQKQPAQPEHIRSEDWSNSYWHFGNPLLASDAERLERDKHVDFKSALVQQRAIDRGTIAHYFLSLIKHDTPGERALAAQRTRADFGGLYTDFEPLFKALHRFLDENPDLYNRAAWPKVFNEYALFDVENREIRIDRMMVNSEKKEIFIVDYKTGDLFEPDQIAHYVETVKNLENVKRQGFRVSGDFYRIQL